MVGLEGKIPSRNGWELGVPLWLKKPPYVSTYSLMVAKSESLVENGGSSHDSKAFNHPKLVVQDFSTIHSMKSIIFGPQNHEHKHICFDVCYISKSKYQALLNMINEIWFIFLMCLYVSVNTGMPKFFWYRYETQNIHTYYHNDGSLAVWTISNTQFLTIFDHDQLGCALETGKKTDSP